MQPLYLNKTVRQGLGSCLKTGGEALTKMALDQLKLQPDQRILDVGCGNGGGLSVLQEYGLKHCLGLEFNDQLAIEASQQHHICQGDMAHLPIKSSVFDVLFCECAWNLSTHAQALTEFNRDLSPVGTLVLSDIFVRHKTTAQDKASWPRRSCFFQADSLPATVAMVQKAGFQEYELFDVSYLLKQAAAEFIFAHGSLFDFWRAVMGNDRDAEAACSAATTTKPGLFLMIARKGA